jgi:hypothetical protein
VLSCAGSATKEDEAVNSFKVYYFASFDTIYMQEFRASSAAGIYSFVPSTAILLNEAGQA